MHVCFRSGKRLFCLIITALIYLEHIINILSISPFPCPRAAPRARVRIWRIYYFTANVRPARANLNLCDQIRSERDANYAEYNCAGLLRVGNTVNTSWRARVRSRRNGFYRAA